MSWRTYAKHTGNEYGKEGRQRRTRGRAREKDEYVTDFSKQNWKNRLKFIQAK